MELAKRPSAREQELDRLCGYGRKNASVELTVAELGESPTGLVITGSGLRVLIPYDRGKTEKAGNAESTEYTGDSAGARSQDLHIGNRIRISGRLSRFQRATNPGQFDYASYYRAKGLTHSLYAEGGELTILDGRVDRVPDQLQRLKRLMLETIRESLPPREAGFLSAVLLGDRTGLDRAEYQLYRENGIAHLLAISGVHVGILGLGLYQGLRALGLGFPGAGLLSALFLYLYGMLTGGTDSVFRAGVMLSFFFLASCLGESYDLRSAASAGLLLLLVRRPFALFQCGVQLSFLAVFSIGGPGKALQERAGELFAEDSGRRRRIRLLKKRSPSLFIFLAGQAGAVMVSVTVFLWSLPVVAWWFFSVPPYGILLNLLVIPLMGLLLLSGLASLALYLAAGLMPGAAASAGGAAVGPAMQLPGGPAACNAMQLPSGAGVGPALKLLGDIAAGILRGVLSFYHLLCSGAGHLPGHRVLLGRPELWQVGLYYLLLGLAWWWVTAKGEGPGKLEKQFMTAVLGREGADGSPDRKDELPAGRAGENANPGSSPGSSSGGSPGGLASRVLPPALLVCSAFLSLCPVLPLQPEVWFLDVGQGDSIVVRLGRECVLVDGGSSTDKKAGEAVILPFLQSKGVGKVDCIYLTHADQDHVNGLSWLLSDAPELGVGCAALSGAAEGDARYDDFRSLLSARRIPVRYLWAGERAGVFSCLSPGKGDEPEDLNEQSTVLLFSWKGDSVILTGDAGASSEQALLKRFGGSKPEGDVILKAGHHGSGGSSSAEFLAWASPAAVIYSCGRDNFYGHPSPETVERVRAVGARQLGTPDCGAVCVRRRWGGGWKIACFLHS